MFWSRVKYILYNFKTKFVYALASVFKEYNNGCCILYVILTPFSRGGTPVANTGKPQALADTHLSSKKTQHNDQVTLTPSMLFFNFVNLHKTNEMIVF